MSLQPTTRIQSFRYALRGIGLLIRTETNARIHLLATITVVVVGYALEISRTEWLAITLAITAVWCAEALNSAIESTCDAVSSEPHPKIERAKDLAAGAVLLTATGAIVIAVLVFGPHFLDMLGR
jgi:diacylglycerol kinase